MHPAELYWYVDTKGELIPKDVYYFNRMDRKEKSKSRRETLKEWIESSSTLDLRMVDPNHRKEAIISHIKFMDSLQKELRELKDE
jgi:hypothetical protein